MTALLPCPLCGAAMIACPDPGFHEHPPTDDCILGHMIVAPDEVAAWNRRPLSSTPVDASQTDDPVGKEG